MSRVLFVSLDEDKIIARCKAEDVGISALESLPKGGMRLVCKSVEGAALMSLKLKTHLMSGDVTRTLHRPKTPLW